MFCDEVYPRLRENEKPIMALSHKFFLTDNIFKTCEQIGVTPQDAVNLMHLFKLPFSNIWFEWRVNGHPIGVSLRYMGQEEKNKIISMNLKGNIEHIEDIDEAVSVGWVTYEDLDSWLCFPKTLRVTENGNYGMQICCGEDDFHRKNDFVARSVISFLCLAVLNSRNLIEVKNVELSKLNNSRQKQDKAPLFEYKILDINPTVRKIVNQKDSKGGENGGVRAHWRRGHFKTRKTGIFWWNPHLAGKHELGFIEKDYVA